MYKTYHNQSNIFASLLLGITICVQPLFTQENNTGRESGLQDFFPEAPATRRRPIFDRSFNPSIGAILNGQYRSFSAEESHLPGFAMGEEGARPAKGFSVDHTELNFSANADNVFKASLTFALAEHAHGHGAAHGHEGEDEHEDEGEHEGEDEHEGESVEEAAGGIEVELEEAFIQSLPAFILPTGMSLKIGRAFWTLGYLNEHHSHTDDFSDRPLPYRAFLDNAFNDAGAQLSYVLPTDLYVEGGAGAFHGADHPFSSDRGMSTSAFLRVGSDIGANHSFRIGASQLLGESLEGQERAFHGGELAFAGSTRMYIADFRYTWAPSGNARNMELSMQGEYFWYNDKGSYHVTAEEEAEVDFDGSYRGWYAQLVFKFHPEWRIALRHSNLQAADIPEELEDTALDAKGFQPRASSFMIDWSNSEFSRLRIQYNREELALEGDHDAEVDEQFIIQYIVSIGAHAAHKY